MRVVPLETLMGHMLNEVEQKYAPSQVYVQGPMRIPLLPSRVSVIGTRHPTDEGVKEARRLTRMLVENDVTVVSGLAAGIDTIAHETAIESGGRTIAVLGTPLNRTYPKENTGLQKRIAENHLLISQFPNRLPVTKKNFVMRNRTMALISGASVIVEAGENSGTRHQGWESIRMRRPLFVCGPAARQSPTWLEEMIPYGAVILDKHDEILDMIPHNIKIIDVFR